MAGTETSGPAVASDQEDLAGEIAALREAVERQGQRVDELQELLEQLIAELRRVG